MEKIGNPALIEGASQTPVKTNKKINVAYFEMFNMAGNYFLYMGLAVIGSGNAGRAMAQLETAATLGPPSLLRTGLKLLGVPVDPTTLIEKGQEVADKALTFLARGNLGIYRDIYWQFMAYSEKGIKEMLNLRTAGGLTDEELARWRTLNTAIAKKDKGTIEAVNLSFVDREQNVILQAATFGPGEGIFSAGSAFITSPLGKFGSRNFMETIGSSADITNAEQRWKWIRDEIWPAYLRALKQEPESIVSEMKKYLE